MQQRMGGMVTVPHHFPHRLFHLVLMTDFYE